MSKTIKVGTFTKLELIKLQSKAPCGTYPGQNRSRKFVDRKRKANKNACRGRVSHD
jgi:hypothetical protein